jgi:hypothetical protein
MARITAGVASSHIPALGATLDHGRTGEPYWVNCFAGYDWTRAWEAAEKPDVVILVYNDHATAFDMDFIPTFAIGCADRYNQRADLGHRRHEPPAPGAARRPDQQGVRQPPSSTA